MARGVILSHNGRNDRIVVPGVQVSPSYSRTVNSGFAGLTDRALFRSSTANEEHFEPGARAALAGVWVHAGTVLTGTWTAGNIRLGVERRLPSGVFELITGLEWLVTPRPSGEDNAFRAHAILSTVGPRAVALPAGAAVRARILEVDAGFDASTMSALMTLAVDVDVD